MVYVIISAVYLAVILVDLKPKWKYGEKNVLWVYSTLLVVSLAIFMLSAAKIYPPNPLIMLQELTESLIHGGWYE